jgi:SPP1 gp7 family putative phage head morphogenesis protein
VAKKRRPHGAGRPAPEQPELPIGRRRAPHPVPDVSDDVGRYDEALAAFRRRSPVARDEWDEMEADERRRSFSVAGAAQADVVAEVWEAIDRAIRDGTDLEVFKAAAGAQLAEAWGGEDAPRLETVFRTNVMTAYNDGRYAVFSAPAVKEARPYFRFDAILDDRTDDECEDLNGTVLPQDDPFWDRNTPPLHFNCRCLITGLSRDEAEDEGIDEAPDIQHADDGFGARPDQGEDWSPDTASYPGPIADALKIKLGG